MKKALYITALTATLGLAPVAQAGWLSEAIENTRSSAEDVVKNTRSSAADFERNTRSSIDDFEKDTRSSLEDTGVIDFVENTANWIKDAAGVIVIISGPDGETEKPPSQD